MNEQNKGLNSEIEPILDEQGNAQLRQYVYYDNKYIEVTDKKRIKTLESEHLLEAVYYLLQEVSSQRNEIEKLKEKTNIHCKY